MAKEIVIPLITSAPHNSADLHKFRSRVALTPWQIGEMSDAYTADTVHHAEAVANLVSNEHRALGDKNRTPDKAFPSEDFRGNPVWEKEPEDNEPDTEEKEELLTRFYFPYYEEGRNAIQAAVDRGFSGIIFWDNHDTGDYNPETGKRDRKLKGEDRTMPPFVISNFGKVGTGEIDDEKFKEDPTKAYITAPVEFMRELQGLIVREFGLTSGEVEINSESMRGGNMIQYYGHPNYPSDLTRWAVQVEYNRGFIMDQATRIPYEDQIIIFNERFNRIASDIAQNLFYQQ